ncbi:unnamed protein product [Symbiodinium pilosum]|uniref:Uncharacterized protein n=1 Tax=Symbiodinium pilosum TaxID=2952 RepID=A0A812TSD5_SYMPI|nr:unnamed protein product [Symbiodinium pilosum]
MIRNWKSTDAAFTALNTQPDNMLNHKEFVDGLAKAGCCRTRRRHTAHRAKRQCVITQAFQFAHRYRFRLFLVCAIAVVFS